MRNKKFNIVRIVSKSTCRVADKKKIPVRHWVLQVREFCQTYQLFARPTFFEKIFNMRA